MNGYELITELETRSEGRWRPSPGAIYPALRKLEDRGSITSTEVGGKLQFELTDRGRTMLAYLRGGTGRRCRSTVERGRRRPIARATCAPCCSRWWGRPGDSVVSAPPSRSNRPAPIIADATTKLAALAALADRSPESDEPTTD